MDFAEGDLAAFSVILESDEAFFAAHFGVAIDEGGEDFAVNLLDEGVAFGDDFHGVPVVFFEEGLDFGFVLYGFVLAFTGFVDDGYFSGGGHEVARFFFGMFAVEEGVMPEAHLFLFGDFDLVSENLPIAEIVAADLDAGVALVPAELEAEDEVGGLVFAPDKPVLFF